MNIVFRVDASIKIGSGHVMRCLTLANALKKQGIKVQFICRDHSGNLISFIQGTGYQVFSLKHHKETTNLNSSLAHANWLGCSQEQDAIECEAILQNNQVDWLIVDHYALDIIWEKILNPYCKKLMVIDDLADRHHDCTLLLDQTYSRKDHDYLPWVTGNCQLLLGSNYALLRPEFTEWRQYSLKRRMNPEFKNLLITMGGVDQDNITGDVLNALKQCDLPKDLTITVIMGITAPHSEAIQKIAQTMPYKTDVRMGVNNMAEIMANADLAIGSAGVSTWERCCLGLPSIVIQLAENQKNILQNLTKKGICEVINHLDLSESKNSLDQKILLTLSMTDRYIKKSMSLTRGEGTNKVMNILNV